MIYGIIADMHGNLEALTATLGALDSRGVTQVVCLGDVVGYNADSNACVDLLASRGIPTIAGNHDLIAIGRLGFDRCADKPAFTLRRTRKDLTPTSRAYLAALPPWLMLGDDVVLVHGGVDDPQEYVTTPGRVLDNHARLPALAPRATICFFGHTHAPKLYELSRGGITERLAAGTVSLRGDEHSYFINPGSVDGSRKPAPRVAELALYDADARTVEFVSVPYDYEAVERRASERGYRMTSTDVWEYKARRMLWRARLIAEKRVDRLLATFRT